MQLLAFRVGDFPALRSGCSWLTIRGTFTGIHKGSFKGIHKGSIQGLGFGSFRKLGVPYFGVLIIRILLFRVLYSGPLFSETPIDLEA